MTTYEIYVFLMCFIVFALLTVVFTALVWFAASLLLKLIRSGSEDEKILSEYRNRKIKSTGCGIAEKVFSAVLCIVAIVMFGGSMCLKIFEKDTAWAFPVVRVVYSSSMSEKSEKNRYLFENDLEDQFARFDLIVTHSLPDEFDLELYDIVVYRSVKDELIVHRIVEIEEPNAEHPDGRLFVLQGDAVEGRDKYMVSYAQMRGIYRGERVPFIGSFIVFMQSPAGYLCFLLLIFGVVAIPLMERKIEREKLKRVWIAECATTVQNDETQRERKPSKRRKKSYKPWRKHRRRKTTKRRKKFRKGRKAIRRHKKLLERFKLSKNRR